MVVDLVAAALPELKGTMKEAGKMRVILISVEGGMVGGRKESLHIFLSGEVLYLICYRHLCFNQIIILLPLNSTSFQMAIDICITLGWNNSA